MKLLYILFPVMIFGSAACTRNTTSDQLINKEASLPASFNFSKMGLKVISSSINKTKSTMSTLYGNDVALNRAKTGKTAQAGEVFALLTWKQKEDKHWFGAKIPGNLLSLEMVKTSAEQAEKVKVNYQRYEGNALALSSDTTGNDQRIHYIFAQQPSVMP